MKTLRTGTIVVTVLLLSLSASATYFEDFDDGLAQGWLQNGNAYVDTLPLGSVVEGVVDGAPGSWALGEDGEMARIWGNPNPDNIQGGANLDDGLGTYNFGDGTYQIDIRFGAPNDNPRASWNLLGTNPGPSTGDVFAVTTDQRMINSLSISIGAAAGYHVAVGAYISFGWNELARNTDFLSGGSPDRVYRLRARVSNNTISISGAKGQGNTNFQPLSGLQNIDFSWTPVANSTGYMGLAADDGLQKQFDNISFIPIPEPSMLLLGLVLLLRKKRS